MSWRAIDALADARTETSELLLPFDAGTWFRLALVAVFVGAGTGNASVSVNTGGSVSAGGPEFVLSDLPGGFPFDGVPPLDPSALPGQRTLLLAVAGLAAVGLLLAAAFALVASTMEFVLVSGLADREIRIRGPFVRQFRKGVRLFGFKVGVVALAVLVVGGPLALVALGGVALGPELLLAAVPVVLLGVAVALCVAFVLRFTADFVVPTMLVEDCGVLAGWRRFVSALRPEWEEFALYLLVRFALGIVAGALFAGGVLFLAVLLALPFVLAAGAVVAASALAGGVTPLSAALLVVVGLCYAAAVAVASAVLLAPVVTFFRYYALYVLGGVDPDLDLVGAPSPPTDDGRTVGRT